VWDNKLRRHRAMKQIPQRPKNAATDSITQKVDPDDLARFIREAEITALERPREVSPFGQESPDTKRVRFWNNCSEHRFSLIEFAGPGSTG